MFIHKFYSDMQERKRDSEISNYKPDLILFTLSTAMNLFKSFFPTYVLTEFRTG